jgi:hypothetical protein
MIHVCVPVLKRYDLLREMLLSLERSTVRPEWVYVIDNGMDVNRLSVALASIVIPVVTHHPQQPLGIAESSNWFLQNVPEDRIITNDDIVFAPDSLEKLVAADVDLAWATGCGFACFLIRDSCVAKIGLFDEDISPGYGYYEDEDYLQRLDGRGTREPSARAMNVECGVFHHHSSTLKVASHVETLEHHRKFMIAQTNYIKKWHLEGTFK